jgi:hypothetical protein
MDRELEREVLRFQTQSGKGESEQLRTKGWKTRLKAQRVRVIIYGPMDRKKEAQSTKSERTEGQEKRLKA